MLPSIAFLFKLYFEKKLKDVAPLAFFFRNVRCLEITTAYTISKGFTFRILLLSPFIYSWILACSIFFPEEEIIVYFFCVYEIIINNCYKFIFLHWKHT